MSRTPEEDQLAVELRPARAEDYPAIRDLIHAVQINQLGLDWRRFIIAVDTGGKLIACGQVKPHMDGSLELASIAVIPEWRNQGVASVIIHRLIRTHPGPLFLTCRAGLGKFYERFGFRGLEWGETPAYFRRIARMMRIARVLKFFSSDLLVLKRDG